MIATVLVQFISRGPANSSHPNNSPRWLDVWPPISVLTPRHIGDVIAQHVAKIVRDWAHFGTEIVRTFYPRGDGDLEKFAPKAQQEIYQESSIDLDL